MVGLGLNLQHEFLWTNIAYGCWHNDEVLKLYCLSKWNIENPNNLASDKSGHAVENSCNFKHTNFRKRTNKNDEWKI